MTCLNVILDKENVSFIDFCYNFIDHLIDFLRKITNIKRAM